MTALTARESSFLEDIFKLMDEGVVIDRSSKPLRPRVTIVATQRTDEEGLAKIEKFVIELQQRYPFARLVLGDTSLAEREAARAAQMVGMEYRIIEKAEKGEWDEGSVIRDERCVAASTHIVALDSSARAKTYEKLAARTFKFFSTI